MQDHRKASLVPLVATVLMLFVVVVVMAVDIRQYRILVHKLDNPSYTRIEEMARSHIYVGGEAQRRRWNAICK